MYTNKNKKTDKLSNRTSRGALLTANVQSKMQWLETEKSES
jgi:hypothetical protein